MKSDRTEFFWKHEIPRNYYGSDKVPTLLLYLEEDKEWLPEELYNEVTLILNKVLEDRIAFDKDVLRKREIVKTEKEKWDSEIKIYQLNLEEFCKNLSKKYFKPWKLDTTVYMSQNIDVNELKNEDGEIVEDALNALTYSVSHLPNTTDEDGFMTIVNYDGKTGKRKISGNIIHTNRIEFNELPQNNTWAFWQSVRPNNALSYYVHVARVPPGVKVDLTDTPKEPLYWVESCKLLGVEDPYLYL